MGDEKRNGFVREIMEKKKGKVKKVGSKDFALIQMSFIN